MKLRVSIKTTNLFYENDPILYFSAAAASLPINLLAYKTGRSSLVCKTFIAIGLVGVIGNAYFMRLPEHGAYIVARSWSLTQTLFFSVGLLFTIKDSF